MATQLPPPAPTLVQCITPNPDVSGIGVRAAIYIQAVLSIIHPLIAGADGTISKSELKSLGAVYTGILLPSCALILATIIQARTFGLSVHHAVIVLNLSLINNTSALTFFLFLYYTIRLSEDLVGDPTPSTGDDDQGTSEAQELDAVWRTCTRGLGIIESDADIQEDEVLCVERDPGALPQPQGQTHWITQVYHLLKSLGCSRHNDTIEKAEAQELNTQCEELIQMLEQKDTASQKAMPTAESQLVPQALALLRLEKALLEGRLKKLESTGRFLSTYMPRHLRQRSTQRTILVMAAAASAHLSLVAGFGLWLWFDVRHFGTFAGGDTVPGGCAQYTRLMVLRTAVPVLSSSLRRASLVFYFFTLVPVYNIISLILFPLLVALPISVVVLLGWWVKMALHGVLVRLGILGLEPRLAYPRDPAATTARRMSFILCTLSTLALQLYFITTTELTIKENRKLLVPDASDHVSEGDWTFGQTLAVILTAVPFTDVMIFFFESIRSKGDNQRARRQERDEGENKDGEDWKSTGTNEKDTALPQDKGTDKIVITDV